MCTFSKKKKEKKKNIILKEKRHSTQGKSCYSEMIINFVTKQIKNPLKIAFLRVGVS
jgi:hypothetical protein